MQDALLRLRYRYWPDHLLGEILSKRWTETAIPVIVLLIITILLSRSIPGFLSVGGLADTGRQAGEIGFIVLGMALVVIVGGIDLSVGSMFALCDFCALFCLNVLDWPVPAVIVATLACGAALGAVNGLLIGYLRLRAFITTLITLIIYRSAYDLLLFDYSNKIAAAFPDIPSWNFLGGGGVAGRAERGAGLSRRRRVRACLPDPPAPGLAHHRDRRLAPLGLQFRHSGAAHDRAVLRRKRRADRDRRAVFRRTARHRRRRRRRRPRSHRADRDRARRHQPRRRQGLGHQGAGRHADRAVPDQRHDHAVGERRRQPHGARRRPAGRRHHRHPLAEEPHPHHQQGLCQPDLSRAGASRFDRTRQRARSRKTTSCATCR